MTDLLIPARPTTEPPATSLHADTPATTLAGTVAHDLALAVAPSTGRFRPATVPGARLIAGALVGHVTGGGGRCDDVPAPTDAEVADLLVRPGQLVLRGQGVAWLRRGGVGA